MESGGKSNCDAAVLKQNEMRLLSMTRCDHTAPDEASKMQDELKKLKEAQRPCANKLS